MGDFVVKFTDEDLARASAEKVLEDGWMQFIVTKIEKRHSKVDEEIFAETGKKGHNSPMLQVTQCVLKEKDNADSLLVFPSITDFLVYPILGPEALDGAMAPNTTEMCIKRLRGVLGPDVIPYNPARKDGVWLFNGEEVETPQAGKTELARILYSKLEELWENPDDLLQHAFYGLVVGDTTGRGGKKTLRVTQTLPPDAVLLTGDEVVILEM